MAKAATVRGIAGHTGGKLETARLPAVDAEALRWFFSDYGGQIGLRSSFGDMVNAMANISVGGKMSKPQTIVDSVTGKARNVPQIKVSHHRGIHDPFGALTEYGMLKEIGRATDVFRRLSEMNARGDGALVSVLWRMYGPRPPGEIRVDVFGDVAPVVEFTEHVERERLDLAAHLAADRLVRWGVPEGDRAKSIREQAKREVTTGDVIRQGVRALDVSPQIKGETRKAYDGRVDLARAAVDRWAQPIRHEAMQLVTRACASFRNTHVEQEAA